MWMNARKGSEVAQREVRWYSVQREWRWAWWLPRARLFKGFVLSLWGNRTSVLKCLMWRQGECCEEREFVIWGIWFDLSPWGNERSILDCQSMSRRQRSQRKIAREEERRERLDILTFLCQSLKGIPKRNFCKISIQLKHRFPMSRFRFYRKKASKS